MREWGLGLKMEIEDGKEVGDTRVVEMGLAWGEWKRRVKDLEWKWGTEEAAVGRKKENNKQWVEGWQKGRGGKGKGVDRG